MVELKNKEKDMLLPKFSRHLFVVLSVIALTVLVGSGRVAGLSGSNGFPAFKFLKFSDGSKDSSGKSDKSGKKEGVSSRRVGPAAAGGGPAKPGTLAFSASSYTVAENGSSIQITVERTQGSDGQVAVNYSTSNGTASAGADYAAASGALTFADGETSKTFVVQITDDQLDESDETVNLALSNPSGGAKLGAKDTAALTITDNDAPPTISISNASAAEGDSGMSSAVFTVTLSAPSGLAIQVDYDTKDDSAKVSDDYVKTTGTLSFNPGETSKTIAVPVVGEFLIEPDESFKVELSRPANASIQNGIGAGTIMNDDVGGDMKFSVSSLNVKEDGNAVVTVMRTGGKGAGAKVNYATANGSAIAGTDYIATSGTLTFGGNEMSKTFTVSIINDDFVEDEKTITLILSDPINASIGNPSNATIKIEDNDVGGTVQFESSSFQVNENRRSESITVTRTGGDAAGVTVSYATSNGTAISGADYAPASGTLTFGAGESSKTFTVNVEDDNLNEDDETVNLTLSSPGGGASLGSPSNATLRIIDNSPLPKLTVSDVTVSEGQTATLFFNLSVPSGKVIDVVLKTSGATAKADIDYIEVPDMTVTFMPGETQKPFSVVTKEDTIAEGREFLVVNILESKNVSLPGGSAKIFIDDNDFGGSVQFSLANFSIKEDGGFITVTVTRTDGEASDVSIQYATVAGGTAIAGTDYTSTSGTLIFGAGEMSKQFTIPVIDNTIVDGNKTINLLLSNVQGGATIGNTLSSVATIVDDDIAGNVQFSIASIEVSEDGKTATVTVTRAGGDASGVTIDYSTVGGGTAIEGTDYTAVNGTLTFGVGETTKTFTVPITDNTLASGDKTINLQLTNPKGGASLGSISSAVITIKDNDIAGSIQFSSSSYTVKEDVGTMTVMVTRSGGLAGGVSIDYSTIAGTAKSGLDYTPATGTLTFGAGESSKMFNVEVINDTLVEDDETVTLALANPKGGALIGGVSTAVLTILDNEVPGAIQFSASAYVANKGDSEAVITVTRKNGFDGDVSVGFITSNGTAIAGVDYTAASGALNFVSRGANARTFTVPLLNSSSSGDKTINLFLTGPAGGVKLGNPQAAVLTIIDVNAAKPAQIQFSGGEFRVGEADGMATINVTRGGNLDAPVTVAFGASGGTATMGSDFSLSSGTLTFGPGVSTQSFNVRIINDAIEESDETVNLVLLNPTGNAVLGQIGTATLFITDDDVTAPSPRGIEVDKTVDFGDVTVGQTVTRSINIRNTGGVDVSFSAPSLVAGTNGGFSIVSQPASLTLGPGQTTSFNVALKPTAQAESLSGAAVIRSNGVELITMLIGSATDRTIFEVIRPREREVLTAGLPYAVRFSYINRELPTSFTIAYSVDGGATFPLQNQIGIIGPNSRSVIWNVPDDLVTDTGRIQVIGRFPSGVVATALSGIFSVRKPGAPPNAITIGDFNKDGIPDLAIAKAGAQKLTVLVGKGDGGFAAPIEMQIGVDPRAIINADFNNDGIVDIATANQDSGSVSILFGRGDASFNAPKNIQLNSSGASIAVGDLNGDGNIDIAVGNVKPSSLSLLFGDGKGNFGDLKSFALPAGSKGIAIGDFNRDGNLDVTTANFGSDDVSVLLGDGKGNFDGTINSNAARSIKVGISPASIAIGDFNEDGIPDLATANFNSDDVSVLIGDGRGGFNNSVEFQTGFGPTSMTVKDFDKDGHLDIVTANLNTNDVGVLFGDGLGTFSAAVFYPAAQGPAAIGSGDFNLDNNLDIITSNQISDDLTILIGDGRGGFADAATVGGGGAGPSPEPTLRVLLTFDPPAPGVFAPPSNLKANASEAGRNPNTAQPSSNSISAAADSDLVGFNIYRVPAPGPGERTPTADEIVGDPKNLVGSAPASATSFTDTVSTDKGNNFVYSATSFFGNGQQSSGSSTASTDLPVIKNPTFSKNSLFIDSAGSFISTSGAMLIINDSDAFPLTLDDSASRFTVSKNAKGSVSGATLRRILRRGASVRLVVKNPDGKLSVGVQFTRSE